MKLALRNVGRAALAAAVMGFPERAGGHGANILAWRLASDETKHADVASQRRLDIGIVGEAVGVVASRVTLLAAGTYEVAQVLTYEEGAPSAVLTWDLVCMGPNQASLWHYSMPVRAGSSSYRTVVAIPSNCPAQQWLLQAAGEPSQSGSRALLGPLGVASINAGSIAAARQGKAATATEGR